MNKKNIIVIVSILLAVALLFAVFQFVNKFDFQAIFETSKNNLTNYENNKQNINNFEECKSAGNLVIEGDPTQCLAGEKIFIDDVGPKRDCEKTSCPVYTPPENGWCPDGNIVTPLKDKCGCDGPPRCE